MTFREFGLKEEILSAIEAMGFENPTEIQEKAIPLLLGDQKQDFVGLAQTGTGKTAAFGLPLLQYCDPESKNPLALILSPTRELCMQITEELRRFSKNIRGLKVTAVYGGANISTQISELRRGTQVVVATPGRLLDLIRRNKINISAASHVVLDEADIMLNMGFKDELDSILEETPKEKRVVLFSATMPPEVARIAATYMHEPVEITVGKKNAGSENIEHSFVMVHSRDKYQALKRLLDFHPDIYGIVFCRTKTMTQQIADRLIKDDYSAESLHGDLSQTQRDQVMKKFRSKSVQVLVATDVAARGLDVDSLTHVIHFDLPDDPENYVHRSGRTGRAGRKGASIAIIHMKEKGRIRTMQRMLKGKIDQISVPSGEDICAKQLISLVDKVHAVKVDEEMIAPHMPIIEEKLASLDREDLLKRVISLEFHRFMTYYKNAEDINPAPQSDRYGDRGDRGDRGRDSWKNRQSGGNFQEIRLNVGRKDGVLPPQIIGLINQMSRVRNIPLGRIDIHPGWTFVEVESEFAAQVVESLKGADYQGRMIKAQFSEGRPADSGGYRGGKPSSGGGYRGKPSGKSGGYKGKQRGGGSDFSGKKGSYSGKKTGKKKF